jgi:DNA-binding XRE family transcriptional regulator
MKTFSEKVREARQSLKLTQEELGALIGVSSAPS